MGLRKARSIGRPGGAIPGTIAGEIWKATGLAAPLSSLTSFAQRPIMSTLPNNSPMFQVSPGTIGAFKIQLGYNYKRFHSSGTGTFSAAADIRYNFSIIMTASGSAIATGSCSTTPTVSADGTIIQALNGAEAGDFVTGDLVLSTISGGSCSGQSAFFDMTLQILSGGIVAINAPFSYGNLNLVPVQIK